MACGSSDGDGPGGSGLSAEAQQCVQSAIGRNAYAGRESCVECGCQHCTERLADCYDSDDADRNAKCSAVVECGQRSGCSGATCYCGDQPLADCVSAGPAGPCVQEIETAAGVDSSADPVVRVTSVASVRESGDMSNALVLANLVGDCTRGAPEQGAPLPRPAVMGNCESECMLTQ
jgi:hypothetical protein